MFYLNEKIKSAIVFNLFYQPSPFWEITYCKAPTHQPTPYILFSDLERFVVKLGGKAHLVSMLLLVLEILVR